MNFSDLHENLKMLNSQEQRVEWSLSDPKVVQRTSETLGRGFKVVSQLPKMSEFPKPLLNTMSRTQGKAMTEPCQDKHLDSIDQTAHSSRTSAATIDPPKPSPVSTSCNSSPELKNIRRHKNKFRPLQTLYQVPPKAPIEETEVPPAPKSDTQQTRTRTLRARRTQRLDGAPFRYLNEQLYSGPSSAAQRLFQEDPEAFLFYHRGFQKPVKKWPLHPVDRIAKDLRQKPTSLAVADFVCADCRLASSVWNPVYCFDLAFLDLRVIVCDMARGVGEALLNVAEVSSCFEDIQFWEAMTKLGFKVIYTDLTSGHFFLFDFTNTGPPRVGPQGHPSDLKLQPCYISTGDRWTPVKWERLTLQTPNFEDCTYPSYEPGPGAIFLLYQEHW
ncbi:hypothetical protein STEG23_001571 [Scotinomys teguina]